MSELERMARGMKRRNHIKRRKRRKHLLMIRRCMFCILYGFLVALIAKGVQGIYKKNQASSQSVELVSAVTEVSTREAVTTSSIKGYKNKLKKIEENAFQYSVDLIELAKKNPETIDFVLEYLEKKDIQHNIDLSDSYTYGEIPYLLQWDERWGYQTYGDDMIGLSGCGPVCLSMVYIGLTGDTELHPKEMAAFSMRAGYYVEGTGTSWNLMTEGAVSIGLQAREISLNESVMMDELLAGRVMICSMRPGDFTTSGHFIVIYGYQDGNFQVYDPNRRKNSERGWSFQELEYQINNLWAYSAG